MYSRRAAEVNTYLVSGTKFEHATKPKHTVAPNRRCSAWGPGKTTWHRSGGHYELLTLKIFSPPVGRIIGTTRWP
ncbi:MAG TPA: hypothetical protein DHV53_07490, partial [Gammaproteobacteria bacterium]|nr:hypothetical protein [Gammaproteobacteria bacterium]